MGISQGKGGKLPWTLGDKKIRFLSNKQNRKPRIKMKNADGRKQEMNQTEISKMKETIRRFALAARAALTDEERREKSELIHHFVTELPEFQAARTVMLFLNFRDEVETTMLAMEVLTQGKELVLPRCAPGGTLETYRVMDLTKDIKSGTYGIREPKADEAARIEPRTIDLVIVPGVAFDRQGNRLGYGAGYYDRFFQRLPAAVPLVAAVFECQLVPAVPVESHDHKMSRLITEKEIYDFALRQG